MVGDEFLFHIYACAMRIHEQGGLQYEIVCFLYLLLSLPQKVTKKSRQALIAPRILPASAQRSVITGTYHSLRWSVFLLLFLLHYRLLDTFYYGRSFRLSSSYCAVLRLTVLITSGVIKLTRNKAPVMFFELKKLRSMTNSQALQDAGDLIL